MNFEFSDEQNLLREQARGFLEQNCQPKAVRAVLEGEESYDYALWDKIIEMGWTSAVIPEEFGGLGLSYLELSVISEELGRVCAPVPFSSTVYLLTEAILASRLICGLGAGGGRYGEAPNNKRKMLTAA